MPAPTIATLRAQRRKGLPDMAIHPRHSKPMCVASDEVFADALQISVGSGAAELIEQWNSERRASPRGGRRPLPYTVLSWLTSLIVLFLLSRPPTVINTYRTLLDFTPGQLAQLGIDPTALDEFRTDIDQSHKGFLGWLNTALECLDSGPDQPATRISLAETERIVSGRTAEQRDAYVVASQRCAIIVNAILATWIDPKWRQGRRGDLVVDGMIVDLAGPAPDLTRKERRARAATYFAGMYRRDSRHHLDQFGERVVK